MIFGFCGFGQLIFGSVFRFSHLKTTVFQFWGLPRFSGCLQFSLWFSVFVNNDGGFSDSLIQCILRFFWFCQVTPRSCTKTGVIPRDHLDSVLSFLLKDWMTSLY